MSLRYPKQHRPRWQANNQIALVGAGCSAATFTREHNAIYNEPDFPATWPRRVGPLGSEMAPIQIRLVAVATRSELGQARSKKLHGVTPLKTPT